MDSITFQTTGSSRFGMPVSGHPCVQGKTAVETTVVRERALTGVAMGLAIDAFPGPDAWSPPI